MYPEYGSSSDDDDQPHSPARKRQRGNFRAAPLPPPLDFDGAYFQSYSLLSPHEEIIKDSVLINTYKKAIMHHRANIEGKVVLDVGCGTGLIAMFCAQAGARKDVEIPGKVDVIISEWMGNMLFCENMLSSIITAKERWLKTGGVILPSSATLYMAPFTNPKRHREVVELWRGDFYGIDRAYIERIKPENLLTCHHVQVLDVLYVSLNNFGFQMPGSLNIKDNN
ncbi:hypothetical protein PIB30_008007 [Stylosanthes scabra]|uniref:Protein arginine methyltransferase 6 n=1 Tax=Stylosanthes scabra TaxID=79078 RepID=A0ABU6V504_9FABA|nr:hypothetical protein [Stylosanthes scabra]